MSKRRRADNHYDMADWTLPSQKGWSLLHDVALLYLTCMHGPDAEIDVAESVVVKRLLEQHSEGAGVEDVYNEVMLMYVGNAGGEMIATSIAALGEALSQGQRFDLLREFSEIASADGLVFPSEVNLISEIASRWGLPGPADSTAGGAN